MAMSVPKVGLSRFMKEGSKQYQGVEEAVARNIEACTELANQTKSSYGPNGMNKMVINHLGKLFVTNDAATILNELEVEHPAAKMLVFASKMQEKEVGDGTNAVIIFAAALLENALELINMGIKPTEVADGFEHAAERSLELLSSLVCAKVEDVHSADAVRAAVRSAVMSKQYGNERLLADLVVSACVQVLPENSKNFNVDCVRVCKILGAGVGDSTVMNGMVFKRSSEGAVKKATNAKIAVFTCPFDLTQTETKGTVLINTAQELKDFGKGEEAEVEKQVQALADAGVSVVVSGGKFGDLYLHYLNRHRLMAVRIQSKFELRRLCRAVGATAMPTITLPPAEALGHCGQVQLDEIGDIQVVLFRQTEGEHGRIATVLLRGASENQMDDIERAVDDAVNTFKALTKDDRLVPGAGAVEIELARQIESFGEKCSGMEQYAIKKFALALEALPKQLADNAGAKATELLAKLYAAHQKGEKNAGVDIEAAAASGGSGDAKSSGVADAAATLGVLDLYLLKWWMIKLATNAAATVLRIDHIIMAKQAGGPKPRDPKAQDEED